MSTYEVLIAALKNGVESVAEVGPVHDHARLTTTWEDFLAAFTATFEDKTQVRGWWVTLDTLPAVWSLAPGQRPSAHDRWGRMWGFVVRGVMAVQDDPGSEATFFGLVESVMDALDALTAANLTIAGRDLGAFGPASNTAPMRPAMFGDVLCHFCEISFPVVVLKVFTG